MNRLQGSLPKVGIRPVIDGRRQGVRESLEEQTMNMAKTIAARIKQQLRHPSGELIECVVCNTIGGVAESTRCEDLFRKEYVGVSLTVTPCWAYGTETMDMTPHIPKAIWGFNGTERPGAVYLAAASAGHAQMGDPVFTIYGKAVQDNGDSNIPNDVLEKIMKFVKAGLAVSTMKGKSYVSIGSVSMGIAGSVVDADFFSDYLGMKNEYIDMVEIRRRLDKHIYDTEEYKRAIAWTRTHCIEGKDYNITPHSQETKNTEWEITVKMTLIIRDIMIGNKNLASMGFEEEAEGHNAIVSGFQGQRHWTDHMPNGDFSEAILNSSFDWNGIRQAFMVATENDCLNGITMLFGHLLTGTAQIFADVRTYWSPESVIRVSGQALLGLAKNGVIHLINSGSATLDATGDQTRDGKTVLKPYWEITEHEMKQSLENTKWCPAILEYFRGGGFSSQFLTKANDMPVTMSRINLVKGIGPVLQIAEGWAVDLEKHVHDILDQRTNPTWPATWFVPRITGVGAFASVYSVMNNWGANHGAISYEHIGDELLIIASMLRIPVAMHNVDQENIFRPKVWASFGTQDMEGADFRACQNFGPLYGKLRR